MKTLAELKRELEVGDSITTIKNDMKPDLVGKKRYIIKKQGNGVYLNEDKNAKTGSFLEFKNAKLTEYDGEYIRVYKVGKRPMTEEEKKVIDNVPSKRKENEERIKMELMTDTNGSWYIDRAYFKEHGMEYLHSSTGQTKRIDYNDLNEGVYSIIDEQVKGELELEYKIEKGLENEVKNNRRV
jgi:hypothetical protein